MIQSNQDLERFQISQGLKLYQTMNKDSIGLNDLASRIDTAISGHLNISPTQFVITATNILDKMKESKMITSGQYDSLNENLSDLTQYVNSSGFRENVARMRPKPIGAYLEASDLEKGIKKYMTIFSDSENLNQYMEGILGAITPLTHVSARGFVNLSTRVLNEMKQGQKLPETYYHMLDSRVSDMTRYTTQEFYNDVRRIKSDGFVGSK